MRRVECEGGTVELKAGAWTPQAWASNFGDSRFYKVVTGGVDDPSDILRLAYCLAATADAMSGRETRGYHDWLLGLGSVDLITLRDACRAECLDGLFRDAAKRRGEAAEGAKRDGAAAEAPAAGPGSEAGPGRQGDGGADGR